MSCSVPDALSPLSEWDRIKSPGEDKIVPYANLSEGDPSSLQKLAVLKVNGGLGTSMGASSSSVMSWQRRL